jgi:hypothetical protein
LVAKNFQTEGDYRIAPLRHGYLKYVDTDTQWSNITLSRWYGKTERQVEITTGLAVWYHTGLPVVPIRWVLVRDPLGKFKTQALLCTNPKYRPQQVLEWFVRR